MKNRRKNNSIVRKALTRLAVGAVVIVGFAVLAVATLHANVAGSSEHPSIADQVIKTVTE